MPIMNLFFNPLFSESGHHKKKLIWVILHLYNGKHNSCFISKKIDMNSCKLWIKISIMNQHSWIHNQKNGNMVFTFFNVIYGS
jgi:hypothetical protein